MRKHEFLALAAFTFLLVGCTTPEVRERVVVTPTAVAEVRMVEIIKPADVVLIPVTWDAPRSTTPVIADKPECKITPVPLSCISYPIDYANSNLYRGMDKSNYLNYRVNQVRIDGYVRTLNMLIDDYNKRAAEYNAKLDAKNAAPPTPPQQ